MNLTDFAFPEVSAVDMAFPTFKTNPLLLAEAKQRGFYNSRTPYHTLFNKLWIRGGKVEFKAGVDEAFKAKAWPYCRALMGSFEPKHEEKEAVCAMLMAELLNPV